MNQETDECIDQASHEVATATLTSATQPQAESSIQGSRS